MNLFKVFQTEPTLVWGAIGGLVTALIALGVAFGLHLSDPQSTAINVVVAAIGTVVTLFVVRSQVTPTATLPTVPTQVATVVPPTVPPV